MFIIFFFVENGIKEIVAIKKETVRTGGTKSKSHWENCQCFGGTSGTVMYIILCFSYHKI